MPIMKKRKEAWVMTTGVIPLLLYFSPAIKPHKTSPSYLVSVNM